MLRCGGRRALGHLWFRLAREIASEDVACHEVIVPTGSRRRHGAGKDDVPGAARQALPGEDLAVPKPQDGWVEEARARLRWRQKDK